MPIWLYEVRPIYTALILVVLIETLSMIGLALARRFVIPRVHYHDGANDAVSGTVQAIGVFYGITVGLIAVGVWNTNSNASELVSKEATSIATLYRDVSGYPLPLRDGLRSKLRDYTVFRLYAFEPATPGQVSLHNETLKAYNTLIEYRRLRIDAVDSGLSSVMWAVIWLGAAISIGVAYFFNIPDPKLHAILVALMGGFLAIVLFMIVINDKPFYGYVSVSSDPYKLILDRLIDLNR